MSLRLERKGEFQRLEGWHMKWKGNASLMLLRSLIGLHKEPNRMLLGQVWAVEQAQ